MANEVEERRWQTNTRSFKQGAAHIFKTKEFWDLLFVAGTSREEFKAHRLWVAAASPELWQIVAKDGKPPPYRSKVYLPDVNPEAFKIVFDYFYTRALSPIPSPRLLLNVYKLSAEFGQKGIQEHCEREIDGWELNCSNVLSMFQMSSLGMLREKCLEYLKANAREVLKSEGIVDAKDDTLAIMFENGYCDGIPIMEVFESIVGWSCDHFRIPNDDPESKQDAAAKRKRVEDRNTAVRAELMLASGNTGRSLMSWIRFDKMTVEEVSRAMAQYPKLINDDEFTKLILYACAQADKKPDLPSWINP